MNDKQLMLAQAELDTLFASNMLVSDLMGRLKHPTDQRFTFFGKVAAAVNGMFSLLTSGETAEDSMAFAKSQPQTSARGKLAEKDAAGMTQTVQWDAQVGQRRSVS